MKLNSQKFQFREKHFHFIYTGPKIKCLYHFIILFHWFVRLPPLPICGVKFLPVSLQSRIPAHLHLLWTVVHLHIPIRLWHFLFSHNLLHFPLKQHSFRREINANRDLRSNLQYSEKLKVCIPKIFRSKQTPEFKKKNDKKKKSYTEALWWALLACSDSISQNLM